MELSESVESTLSPLAEWLSKLLVSVKQNVLLFRQAHKTPMDPIRLLVMVMDKTPFSEHSNPYFMVLKGERMDTNTNNHERSAQRIPV